MAKNQKKKSRNKGHKAEPSTWVITVVFMVLACVLGIFLPHRIAVLLSAALGALSIFAIVAAIKGKEKSRIVSWGVSFGFVGGLASFIGFVYTVSAYSFYKEPFIPFWEISLVLGLAVSIFVTVKWVWKNIGVGWRIGSIALGTFLVFFLCCISLCHLNYLLDFQPPVEKQDTPELESLTP